MPTESEVEFIPKHVIDEQNSHSRYTFPKSKEGIEKVESKAQLDQILRGMFFVEFQSKGINIPYPYEIEEKTRIKNILSISKLAFTVRCRICTNFLTYTRDIDSPSSMFHIESFYSEHDHRLTQKRKIGIYNERVPLDYRTAGQKKIYLDLKKYGKSIDEIERCISELPSNLMQEMRQRVICRHFNISINEFKNIYLKLNSKKEIEFSEFVEDLHKKNYEYRYLPEDLLKENPKITRKYHQPTAFSVNPANHERKEDKNVPEINVDGKKFDLNKNLFNEQKGNEQPKTKGNFPLNDPNTHQIPKPNLPNMNSNQPTGLNGNNPNIPLYKINPHVSDPNNPNLPNVLLIISPSMKEMYRKYGQYMGFDLTFSLIREQPTQTEKEYLVGVFASKNESFRIVIFGLVVTNNQSSMVYKWLFKNFMEIMGKQPQTIITDEEVAIGKALKELKQEGYFHGHHLLDTFHVLTKFRKAVESETFQYLRKMIHAKDKYEYKAIFQECMSQLTSDDEIKVLQDFDYHCEKYCYAHIPPTFVGFGVSDAMNESFHNILKDKIPYEIKYLKAVNIILPFVEQRNEIGTLSLICEIPFEQKFAFPFLKPYRKIVSDRLFYYLIHECSKGITHSIVMDDAKYENNECQKIEEESVPIRRETENRATELRNNMEKSKFQIVTKEGVCLVWKEKTPQIKSSVHESQITCDSSTNYWSHYPEMSTYTTNIYPYSQFEPKLPQQQYKWRCICQMEEKAGLCCSHILKILILRNESLLPYIHPRWFVREENIFEGLKSMMKRDTNLKYVANITTDMSNLNRLKSVRLRDRYVSARNIIKKELEEIVDDKIPLAEGEMTVNDANRRKNLETKPEGENISASEKSKNLIQQEYMEWVSANDETIKLQKQKYFKILEKKRKVEMKRMKREKGWMRKDGSKYSLPRWVDKGGKIQKQEKYVDYVYLKPYEMRDIESGDNEKRRKDRPKKEGDDEESEEHESIDMIEEKNQQEEYQEEEWNSEEDEEEEEEEEVSSKEDDDNNNDESANVEYNHMSKDQVNRELIQSKEKIKEKEKLLPQQNKKSIDEIEDIDQYFDQHAGEMEEENNQYSEEQYEQNHYKNKQHQNYSHNEEEQESYYENNWDEEFENEYQQTVNSVTQSNKNNNIDNQSIVQKIPLNNKYSNNPFKKFTKEQLLIMVPSVQMQEEPIEISEEQELEEAEHVGYLNNHNDVIDISEDNQLGEDVYLREERPMKKRGRPRKHPVKERKPFLEEKETRPLISGGHKKRGRPKKIHQSEDHMSRLESFSKLLEEGGINYNRFNLSNSYQQGYGIDEDEDEEFN